MSRLLESPLSLRGTTVPHRIAKAAMSERIGAPSGAPTDGHLRLYERWADGGAGLLITGNMMIDRRARAESGNVVIEDQQHLEALRDWAHTAKSGGAPTLAQVNHPGRQIPRMLSGQPVAPSAVPMRGMAGLFARPRALTDPEIREIIDRFARTAAITRTAGFDGVQIHAAHGYLISQFLSPKTNLRDDEWGGSPERRRRFLLEVVRAVRRALDPQAVVTVKLNSADFQRGGTDEAESLATAVALAEEDVDLLEISGGTYESAAMFEETVPDRQSSRDREAFFVAFADKVRARVRTPLMVTGGFRTAAGMEEALCSGAVDLVGLARPLAAEPDLPNRLLGGETDAARPVQLATGARLLDSLIQGSWHQLQLDRMGRGRAPDPALSRVRAALGYFEPRQGWARSVRRARQWSQTGERRSAHRIACQVVG